MYHRIEENCIGCGACKKICPTNAIKGEKKKIHIIDGKLCINCGAGGRSCPVGAVRDDSGQIVSKINKKRWEKPVINKDNCYACENCIAACPADALSMKDEHLDFSDNYAVLSSPDRCVSCRWCLDNCQFNAITMEVSDEVN